MNNTIIEIDANYENAGTITTENVKVLFETETSFRLHFEGAVVEVNKDRVIESIEDLSKIQYGGFSNKYLWYVTAADSSDELVQSVISILLEKQANVLRIEKISAESFLNDMGSPTAIEAINRYIKNDSVSDMLGANEAELVILQTRHDKVFFDQHEGIVRTSNEGTILFTSTSYKEDFDHEFSSRELETGKPIVKPYTVPLHEVLLLPTDSNEVKVNKLLFARKSMLDSVELKLDLINRKAKSVQTALSNLSK